MKIAIISDTHCRHHELELPPVDIISTPAACSFWANSTKPVLSDTLISARFIFIFIPTYSFIITFRPIIFNLFSITKEIAFG